MAPPPFAFNPQQQQLQEQTLDTDVEMSEVTASGSNSSPADELPAVIVGSEPWHMSFPNDWLPVITRDLQTQAEVGYSVQLSGITLNYVSIYVSCSRVIVPSRPSRMPTSRACPPSAAR